MSKVEVNILEDRLTVITAHMQPPTTLDPINNKASRLLKKDYNCHFKLKHIQSVYNIEQGDINKFIGTHHFRIMSGQDKYFDIWLEKLKVARPECFPKPRPKEYDHR